MFAAELTNETGWGGGGRLDLAGSQAVAVVAAEVVPQEPCST